MKSKILFIGSSLALLFSLLVVDFDAIREPVVQAATSQGPMFVIDGDIREFFALDPLGVSGANGSRDDIPPDPAEQEDFGGDGTITEFYAAYQDGSLFFAVRGDMYGEPDGDNNGNLILIDLDPGQGTGAQDMDDGLDGFGDDGDPSDLNDFSDNVDENGNEVPEARRPRSLISDAGTNLSDELLMQGVGWDVAFSLTSASPLVAGAFSWGSAGLPGTTTAFAELDSSSAYDFRVTPFGPGRGKPGTVIGAQDGFEVEIPVAQLGLGPGEHTIYVVAIETSDTGYPSPNQLPESSDVSNANHGTMVIDNVAVFRFTTP